MSKDRKSFLLHIDSLDILEDLTLEESGQLFNAIRCYQLGEDMPLKGVVKIAFSPFRNQFIRDIEKYEITCKRRAEAGSKGGKQKVANLANASKCKQGVANVADSDSKNKSVSKSDSKNIKDFVGSKKTDPTPYQQIVDSYNDLIGDDFPKCQALSQKRKTCLKKFWTLVNKDLEKVRNYFGYFSNNADPHHRGQNDRGWRADIEFICREETVMKMREKIV